MGNDYLPITDFNVGDESIRKIAQNHNGVIILFFPKIYSVTCTIEAKAFRKSYYKLNELGYEVIAITVSAPSDVLFFKEELNLPFKIVADTDGSICKQFNSLSGANTLNYNSPQALRRGIIINSHAQVIRRDYEINPNNYADELIKWIKTKDGMKPPQSYTNKTEDNQFGLGQ